MRNYTSDSPEAISRVVALALLADGGLDNSEIEALDKHAILDHLGVGTDTFDRVIQEFCNDVLQSAPAPNVGQIEVDPEVIRHLLGDIRAPELQKQALRAMLDIVNADWCISGGEAILVAQAMHHWGLELHQLPPSGARTGISQSLQIERQAEPSVEGSESPVQIQRLTLLLNSQPDVDRPARDSFQ